MEMSNKYEFFWNGIYSQWYQSVMTIDNIKYNCCEQYMMHQKALYFGDEDTAEKIMLTSHPKDQKALGREVKNFNKEEWDKVNLQIVYKGNLHKFSQNKDLLDELLETGDKILVEASPYDKIWGIGMGENDKDINNPLLWKGQNLLGWVITLVRQELKS